MKKQTLKITEKTDCSQYTNLNLYDLKHNLEKLLKEKKEIEERFVEKNEEKLASISKKIFEIQQEIISKQNNKIINTERTLNFYIDSVLSYVNILQKLYNDKLFYNLMTTELKNIIKDIVKNYPNYVLETNEHKNGECHIGQKAMLLKSFNNHFFIRIYDDKQNYTDFDIAHSDLNIILNDSDIKIDYLTGLIDHSDKTLGRTK